MAYLVVAVVLLLIVCLALTVLLVVERQQQYTPSGEIRAVCVLGDKDGGVHSIRTMVGVEVPPMTVRRPHGAYVRQAKLDDGRWLYWKA